MMITLVAFVAVALLQGWLMQTAVALTGDPAPRYGRALGAVIFTLVSYTISWVGWSWTVGWFMKLFVGNFIVDGLGMALAVLLSAFIVKRRLRLSYSHALVITALHILLSSGAQWVVGRVLSVFAG